MNNPKLIIIVDAADIGKTSDLVAATCLEGEVIVVDQSHKDKFNQPVIELNVLPRIPEADLLIDEDKRPYYRRFEKRPR